MHVVECSTALIARYSQQEELVFRSTSVHICISAFQVKNRTEDGAQKHMSATTYRVVILDQQILQELWIEGAGERMRKNNY